MKRIHCGIIVVVVWLMTLGTLAAYDFEYDAGNIEGSKTSTGITYTLSVSKGNLGTSYDFDTRAGVTSGSPSGIDIDVTQNGATGTVIYANNSLPSSNFTISMNGKLIPPSGGSGGRQPTWCASGEAKAPFHIKSNQNDGAKEIVVPAGTSVTYTAYEGTSSKASNWTVNGQTQNNKSSIIFNRSCWDVPGWFSTSMGTPDPGIYNISAVPTDRPGVSDSGSMTVVGVDRITKIAKENASFWKERSDDNLDYLLCIETGENLKLKAYPKGNSFWPSKQPTWSSSGSWLFSNHISSTQKEGIDNVSINTSEDNDNFTVTVSCGTSSKKVAIKTFRYQFRINVKRSSNNEPINIGLSDVFSGFHSVGHAWWKVGLTNTSINMQDINLVKYANDIYVNVNVGYYPKTSTLPPNFSSKGELRINDDKNAERYREKILTREEFVRTLNYTKNLFDTPGTYVLCQRLVFNTITATTALIIKASGYSNTIFEGADYTMSNEKNCVTVAKGAASAAGIVLENTVTTNGRFDEAGINYTFTGNSPSALYDALLIPKEGK